jgi:hypothetical protein
MIDSVYRWDAQGADAAPPRNTLYSKHDYRPRSRQHLNEIAELSFSFSPTRFPLIADRYTTFENGSETGNLGTTESRVKQRVTPSKPGLRD